MQQIPWSTETNFEQNIVLDGKAYTMGACWNVRNETWSFSLSTIDGIELVADKQINLGIDLLYNVHTDTNPNGILLVLPTNGELNQVITRDNFDVEVEMLYVGDNEVL